MGSRFLFLIGVCPCWCLYNLPRTKGEVHPYKKNWSPAAYLIPPSTYLLNLLPPRLTWRHFISRLSVHRGTRRGRACAEADRKSQRHGPVQQQQCAPITKREREKQHHRLFHPASLPPDNELEWGKKHTHKSTQDCPPVFRVPLLPPPQTCPWAATLETL